MTLTIENVTNLAGFQTDLLFDPAIVHVTAPLLAPSGSTGHGRAGRTEIDNMTGKVTFGGFSWRTAAVGAGRWRRSLPAQGARDDRAALAGDRPSDPTGNVLPVTTADGQAQIVNCFGDFNGDNKVDIFDLQRVASHWNCRAGQPCYDAEFDTELDGDVDVFDLQRFAVVGHGLHGPPLRAPKRPRWHRRRGPAI